MSESWSTALTYLGIAILTLGSALTLIAAIGVVKLPTLLQRVHFDLSGFGGDSPNLVVADGSAARDCAANSDRTDWCALDW